MNRGQASRDGLLSKNSGAPSRCERKKPSAPERIPPVVHKRIHIFLPKNLQPGKRVVTPGSSTAPAFLAGVFLFQHSKNTRDPRATSQPNQNRGLIFSLTTAASFRLHEMRALLNFIAAVKRVIRNTKSGEFLRPDGTWCADFLCAACFSDLTAAFQAAHSRSLQNAEILIVIGDEPNAIYDISLAVLNRDTRLC